MLSLINYVINIIPHQTKFSAFHWKTTVTRNTDMSSQVAAEGIYYLVEAIKLR